MPQFCFFPEFQSMQQHACPTGTARPWSQHSFQGSQVWVCQEACWWIRPRKGTGLAEQTNSSSSLHNDALSVCTCVCMHVCKPFLTFLCKPILLGQGNASLGLQYRPPVRIHLLSQHLTSLYLLSSHCFVLLLKWEWDHGEKSQATFEVHVQIHHEELAGGTYLSSSLCTMPCTQDSCPAKLSDFHTLALWVSY